MSKTWVGSAVGCLLAGVCFVAWSVSWLGPELRAARGDGRVGTFVAVTKRPVHCDDRLRGPQATPCWRGEFQRHDRRGGRVDVWLVASRGDDLTVGARREAIDIGDAGQVYPHPFDAGPSVVETVEAALIGLAAAGAGAGWLTVLLRRRRRARLAAG